MKRKVHAFKIGTCPGTATDCGTPHTKNTVYAVRGGYVSCLKCKNMVKFTATTTSTGPPVEVIIPFTEGGRKKRVMLSWSSGKDAAWTLYTLQQDPNIEIVGLFTTTNEKFDRVAMHSTRASLLQLQAEAAGLRLIKIPLPWPCTNKQYEKIMNNFIKEVEPLNIDAFAFGDLYLESVRDYRINALKDTGIEPIFPIWLLPTDQLAEKMIDSGLKTVLTCINPKVTPLSFAGRDFDYSLLNDMPEGMDPCGENGEFHTFVYEGPMFNKPIPIVKGEVVERDGFVFADVLPITP